VQSQFILTAMAERAAKEDAFRKEVHQHDEKEDAHWESIMESLDLLFTRMDDVERTQQKLQINQDAATAALQQVLKDQATLTQQIQATGQAVAKLQLDRNQEDDSDTSSLDSIPHSMQPRPRQPHPHRSGENFHNPFHRGSTANQHSASNSHRPHLPKMTFPVFMSKDPKIWCDKCEDYFRIFDIPKFLWVSMASMSIDGDAARWVRVEKNRGDLGNWPTFMGKVETKFGAYDYMHALQELLELQQQGSVEDYVAAFESLQFQIEMHNTGYDKMFFITQFTRGLKPEISAAV
jgi:hypothetical protein